MISANWSQNLKQAIAEGKLGTIQDIRLAACWPRTEVYYRRNSSAGKMLVDGKPVFDGPATNALAHLVHNAMYLAGDGADGFDIPMEMQAELYHARPIESYDIACFRAQLRSGITLSAALTHATEAVLPFQIEVKGTKGWARISQAGAMYETSFEGALRLRGNLCKADR